MTVYVALLRAVNVGGRQLKMVELRRLAEGLGHRSVTTHIASGNLLLVSDGAERTVKAELEEALAAHMGKPVSVMVRTAAEMAAVVDANPFPDEPGDRTVAIFLDNPTRADAVSMATNVEEERLSVGRREIYVHYPKGQGRSKLKIPAAAEGTARNMNTVAKLAELAKELA